MEWHVAYICFGKGHRQSGWCKWRKTWILLFPLHHQTSPVPIVALMVAWHVHLLCFAMLASYFFSVRPSEISPCIALKNEVLHNMSFTQTKWNEKYNNNQAFKRRTMENQPNQSKIAPHNSTCLHSQNLQGSLVDALCGDFRVFRIRCCAGK